MRFIGEWQFFVDEWKDFILLFDEVLNFSFFGFQKGFGLDVLKFLGSFDLEKSCHPEPRFL